MTLLRFAALAIFVTGCLDRPLTETAPQTSNVFVDQVAQAGVDKIDLLFMVDNSSSMADKQEILQSAVPVLVRRLTSPICVDPTGAPTGENSIAGKCTTGEPEFNAVADIHVGIVTSSLGSHGGLGSTCNDATAGNTPNDRAHLLGTVRPAGSNVDPKLTFDVANTWNNAGFLAWDSSQKDQPPGSKGAKPFEDKFTDMIAASGEKGCGYEASLESWYRFLVDPEPPANVTLNATTNVSSRGSALITNPDGSTTCKGCDMDLLAQRKAFLRPDSLVAIVMLSDENDCSIRDDGQGWFVASSVDSKNNPLRMPRATAVCATDPDDPCCRSCGSDETTPPKGCGKLSDDDVCKTVKAGQNYATYEAKDDSLNLRCFDQVKRFGFDLLYPTSRYIDALTQSTLTLQSDGKTQVPNPLLAAVAGGAPRDPAQVFLAGIVGVPWQDIADDASLSGPGLNYLSADELVKRDRWSVLLGDPSARPPVPPADPFMVESSSPRMGMNPITHDAIMPATSMSPTASPINGHEQNVSPSDVSDLQYACTFALKTPKPCAAGDQSCDCAASSKGDAGAVTTANSPLCQPPSGGAASTQQNYAKAYPGTRELQVLKGLKDHGIVASICPKVTASANPDSDPSYGYNPAVAAIIDRLKADLVGRCLPRAVQVDPSTHGALCKVVEAQLSGCNCAAPGRAVPDPQLVPAVERQLQAIGRCGGTGQPACSSFCQCEILQETSVAALNACREGTPLPAGSPPGYCYIDDSASPAVKDCPANEKHKLQFVSADAEPTPVPGAVAFVACLGAALTSGGGGGGS